MEKLVPQLMGVSPAVLENVIFLHQVGSGAMGWQGRRETEESTCALAAMRVRCCIG